MADGLPDVVDCARLAEDGAVLHRVYDLGGMARLSDQLAETRGTVNATFEFAKLASGRPGVSVQVDAVPQLVCQRCMQGFEWRLSAASEVEFAASQDAPSADAEREVAVMQNGHVSLHDLAEEELLLALPVAPMCTSPRTCGKAPSYATGDVGDGEGDERRPFSVLQDLLKKT